MWLRPYIQKLCSCFRQICIQVVINCTTDSDHICWSVTLNVFLLWTFFCYLYVVILYLFRRSFSISSTSISNLNANTAKPQGGVVVLVDDQDSRHGSCWSQECVISSEPSCVFVELWFPLFVSSLSKEMAFPTRLQVFQMFAEQEMVDTGCWFRIS